MANYYEIRHTVGFEETNLVGNVYYVNYLRWQGRCREMFLKEKAPTVLEELRDDLKLFTLKAECEFFAEITAFAELSVRMRLEELTQTQIQFAFDYVQLADGQERLVARGMQRIACMRGPNTDTVPSRVPADLRTALAPYSEADLTGRSSIAVLPRKRRDDAARTRAAAPPRPATRPVGVGVGAARQPAQGPLALEGGLGEASLRDVMAQFATGITVITVGGDLGHGMTANAFTSVSLEPPLVLCCVARPARIHEAIMSTRTFGVSVLGADQQDTARYFADRERPRGPAQFDAVDWLPGPDTGAPLLTGALAWLECQLAEVYHGGDHSIFLGEVLNSFRGDIREALLFFGGGYHQVMPPAIGA